MKQIILTQALIMLLMPTGITRAQRRFGDNAFRQQYQLLLQRNIFSRDRRPYEPPQERPATYRPPPPIETDYCLRGITRQNGELTAFFEQLSTGLIDRYPLNARIARGTIQAITLDTIEYAMDAAAATDEQPPLEVGTDPNDPNAVQVSVAPNDPNGTNPAVDPNGPAAAVDANDVNTPQDAVTVVKVHIGQTLQGVSPGMTASFDSVVEDWSATLDSAGATSDTPAEEAAPMSDDMNAILEKLKQQRQQELGK